MTCRLVRAVAPIAVDHSAITGPAFRPAALKER
jgi:hypothetical protein